MQIVRDKSIFRGKAIVQPAKPFFLNPRFHDQQLGSKSQAPSKVTSKLWTKPSTFEKGESSSQNHNSAIQKNLGQENLIQNNSVRETIPSQRLTSDLMEPVK